MAQEQDVLIVGAGVAGIYALYRLRERGFDVRVVDAASDVGGTWYWNRYPGARCDTESLDYSFSFDEALQQEWKWPEKHSGQPAILAYLRHVVDRFDLRRHFQFETRVVSAAYDGESGRWRVTTDRGDFVCRFLILATGFLSEAAAPDIPGLASFAGATYRTSRWPREAVDFAGKRVGLIGTGSSGIQLTPVVAREADRLTVFQRTAGYTVPAWTTPIDAAWFDRFRAGYTAFREEARASRFGSVTLKFDGDPRSALAVTPEERQRGYQRAWDHGGLAMMGAFADVMTDMDANRTCADFLRGKIRDIVKDPEKARKLQPPEHVPVGCKRLINDNGYYDSFNRETVDIVSLAEEPIVGVEPGGIRTEAGFYPLDALILATGFEGMVGALNKIDIRGVEGRTLRDAWRDGPHNYLGLSAAGFPNLFMPNGPLSAGGNTITVTEMLIEWMVDLIDYANAKGLTVDVEPQAQAGWVEEVEAAASGVAAIQPDCRAWWNHPDNPERTLIYFGAANDYFARLKSVRDDDYRGFALI